MPATRVSMILVLAVLLGCGAPAKAPSDTQPGPDTQGPGPDTMAPDVPADGVGDSLADTADTGPRPAPRAWVIEDPADLLPGREAAGRPGDIRVENDHMVAIIGGLGHHKWGPFGGGILDLAPQGGEDRFQELFASAGFLRGLRPEAIEIVADGSTGDAVVRVTGTDGAIPLIDLVAGSQPVGLDVTLEYLLPADARCLEIRTVVSNPTDKTVTAALGDAVVWSETGNVFGPVAGYDAGGLLAQGEVEYVGADQPGLTFLLSPLGGAKVAVALLEDELSLLTYSMVPLAPGESVEVRRCLYATAGDGLDTLALHWEARGQALVDVSGTVQVPTAGYDLSLAKVEVYREDLFVGSVAPSPDGALAFRIPPGSYRGILRGEALEPVEVQWTATTGEAVTDLSFTPAAPARIDAQVTDAAGEPLPGRITVQAGPDAAVQAGHVAVVPSLDGASTLFLPAGTYTLTGSRGPQWSLCRGDVTVGAGQAVEFRCAITPELPLEGWIPGDLHVHSEFSIDSNMPRELRIAALVGEGLRFFAGTEHDVFADYRPIVAALGAEDLITASLGNEVSPIMYHFNCLGCTAITGDYFEVAWMELSPEGEVVKGLDAPAVWEILREEFLATMIQINHPREGQGLFDHVGYDPAAGPEGSPPEKLDLNFDAIEVWNGNQGWDHLWSHTLPDWYSFLNRGIRKVATGNSDSHGLSQWIGQPRNLVQAGAATDEAFYGALGAGRSQVTSGPFIELTVGGGGPGDTVVPPSADAALDLTIRVSAATWIPVDTVLLVGNGAVVQEWPVDTHEGILRFEVTVQVAPSYDTWYHVVARATAEDMSPLYPGRESMSFTNPVWVDRDGDGFDPPIR